MANVLHFNAKGSALQGKLRSVFELQAMAQEDEGKVLLHLAQEVQRLRFVPIWAGILGDNKVKELRTELFSELLGCHNYTRADRESRPLELIQAALNCRHGTMNKEDSQKISLAFKHIDCRGSLRSSRVRFWIRRDIHLPSRVAASYRAKVFSVAVLCEFAVKHCNQGLTFRRWLASLSGSTVAPPRDTPANSPSAFP